MNLALLIKRPMFKRWFIKQLSYYANGWYSFDHHTLNAASSSKSRLVIVAKCHYSEVWQNYPSVSKKELLQIINLQKNTQNPAEVVFQVFSNKSIDGFDVKKISFDQTLMDVLGNNKVLIPETELFSSNEQSILSLQTPPGNLFLSSFENKVTTSYAKGLVPNIETFKLTAGLELDSKEHLVNKEQYGVFLYEQLVQQNIELLLPKLAFNVKTWFEAKSLHLLYWMPLLTALSFFILSNSFLWVQGNTIESELAEQKEQISQLLLNKQEQDKRNHLLKLLNREFSKTATVHNHWALVYNLVESGMVITRLNFRDDLITIKGQSEQASKVLADIAKHPNVISASFNGAVRKSKGQETFTLELVPMKIVTAVMPEVVSEKIESKS